MHELCFGFVEHCIEEVHMVYNGIRRKNFDRESSEEEA